MLRGLGPAPALLDPSRDRALVGRPDRSPDISVREARPGDRYLICSDGLSPVVGTEAIRDVVVATANPGEVVHQLVALAYEAGAPDNVRVIVIHMGEGGARAFRAGDSRRRSCQGS